MKGKEMKRYSILLCFAGMIGLVSSAVAQAPQSKAYPFQLSLVSPVAILNDSASVNGLRINLIYGANENVTGVDLGLVNQVNKDQKGLQLGIINLVGGNVNGGQLGRSEEHTSELQSRQY